MDSSTLTAMTFLDHLADLRKCLVNTVIGVLICGIGALYWSPQLFEHLTFPIRQAFSNFELIGTSPAEAFIIKLHTAFVAGVLVASPNTFLQLWRFISPGLYPNEKKNVIPFVLVSTTLFLSGTFFCYFVMFPYAFEYFYNEYVSIGVQPNIKINEYLSFVIRMIFVFGIVFELPVVSFFLARLGVLSHTWLIKNGRYAVVSMFIIAAILTPPDVISQMLLVAPLLVIYFICIAIAFFFNPRRKQNSVR